LSSTRSRTATLSVLTVVAVAGSGILMAGPAAAASATIILNNNADEIAIFAGYGDQDEDNSISITPRTPGISITDSDAGVRVVDDRGRCRQINATTAHCDAAVSLTVHLGEGDNNYVSTAVVPATIHGGSGVDTIQAGSGADQVFAGGGVDVIRGGAGDDLLDGEGLGDTIEGQAGNDTIWGFENDRAYGGPGDDRFHEHNGWMYFYGDAGNDIVYSVRAGGIREFFGGAGYDTIDYSAWDRKVHVSLDGDDDDGERGVANCEAWIPVTCSSFRFRQNVHSDFENVTGSSRDDWIEGNSLDNLLYGAGGNDVVEGFAGNDTVDAGSGPAETDQKVNGGTGTDICRGTGITSWPGCDG
jgi:Ca2+-binding RTX toxin-like protein